MSYLGGSSHVAVVLVLGLAYRPGRVGNGETSGRGGATVARPELGSGCPGGARRLVRSRSPTRPRFFNLLSPLLDILYGFIGFKVPQATDGLGRQRRDRPIPIAPEESHG